MFHSRNEGCIITGGRDVRYNWRHGSRLAPSTPSSSQSNTRRVWNPAVKASETEQRGQTRPQKQHLPRRPCNWHKYRHKRGPQIHLKKTKQFNESLPKLTTWTPQLWRRGRGLDGSGRAGREGGRRMRFFFFFFFFLVWSLNPSLVITGLDRNPLFGVDADVQLARITRIHFDWNGMI